MNALHVSYNVCVHPNMIGVCNQSVVYIDVDQPNRGASPYVGLIDDCKALALHVI